jgi:hypothetical protein
VIQVGLDEHLPFIVMAGAREGAACVVWALAPGYREQVLSMRRVVVTAMTPSEVHRGNPLEIVEHMATSHLWAFERASDDELNVVVRGKSADYQVLFNWMNDVEALHLACTFELEGPERSNAEIEHLIPMINSQMWVGHFEFWPTERLVVFRHTLVLSGGVHASRRQCEVLLSAALDACERYHSAFQFVAWDAAGAHEALEAAMFETAGEA